MATIAAILDFRSERFNSVWSTSHPNVSYQVSSQISFRFRRKKRKIDAQDGGHCRHLGFPIGTIFNSVWSTSHPNASYQVSSQLVFRFRRKKAKNRCSRWCLLPLSWISDPNDFSYFDLQVTPALPTKFWVNLHFGSGEEVKNRFSRSLLWRPSWISDRNGFSDFDLQITQCFLPSFESIGLSVQEKKRKIDFQEGFHGGGF